MVVCHEWHNARIRYMENKSLSQQMFLTAEILTLEET